MKMNRFILFFARQSLNMLHLLVFIIAIALSYNEPINAIIKSIASDINYALSPKGYLIWSFIIEQPLHISFILLIITVYSVFMSFWILLFSINDNLRVLIDLHKGNEQASAPDNVMGL